MPETLREEHLREGRPVRRHPMHLPESERQRILEAEDFQSICTECPPTIRPHKKGTHYSMRIVKFVKGA